jgi:hypothetical protein
MAVKYSTWSKNITTLSIPRPSKFYQNWNFWFENKPSGNPASLNSFFVELQQLPTFLGHSFPHLSWRIHFGKNGLGYILGDFFPNSSGHPAQVGIFIQ